MKRISLFLSCLFAAVSVFAGNLSGLLNKVGVEYDYDYVFVTNIADNSVKMEGTLNAEALAVEGLAVQVMVDGKVVGDATISNDTVAYAFAGTYAQEDVIQANLLFKYNAGQTVTSGINYVVAYETQFIVTVPDGTEGCYLVFTEQGLEKAVEMEFISLNAFSAVVPFNAWGKEYYYSLKAEEDFYEVDLTGAVISRIYAGQTDTVEAWNQICVPYYELVLNDTVVVAMELEGASYSVYDLELEEGATLQIREHLKDCTDSITNIIAGGDEPLPYKLLEGNLALMQLAGTYDVVFDVETRELVLNRHNGNLLYLYKNYTLSDINAKPYAGFNAAAERVDVDKIGNYYLQITTGSAKTAVAGLVGNAYEFPIMKQIVENPSALVFDYKTNIEGTKSIKIVKTSDDPAFAEPVLAINIKSDKADDWKTMVIYLDEFLADKSVLAQENEDESYYILFDIASDNGLQDGELDIRDMYYAPYIKYSVTVPEGTEVCYLKNEIGLIQMENDAPNHYTLELYDVDRYSQTYNYCAGEGDEFIEVDATGAVLAPRYYHAEDEVVAWKNAYCSPKYGYAMNDQLVQFAETDGGNLIIEKQVIAEEDSAYYIINMCTEDTMKAAEVPAIAGEYKIELVLADTSVIFTKTDTVAPQPDEKEYICNMIWSGETAFGSWATAMSDLSWGGYDWATAKSGDKLTVYFTVDESIGYTNLRFGNGSWAALPSTLADPATDNEGNYSGFAADATSKSITLSQADIDVLVSEGGLVLCGAGLVIKGVELCREADIECNVIWGGATAFGGWEAPMGDLSWGGYDWTTVKQGVKLTVRYEVDATIGYTNLRFGNGSWAALPSTLADPATDNEGNYSGLEGTTSKSIILTKEDLTELVSNGGLVLCGAGLIIKEVELCEVVELVCDNIWSGETAFGSWATAMSDLSWGGYDWATAKSGDKLTVYFTVDESIGYTNLRFGNGSWAALPSTLADPATDNEGNYSGFAADATSKSIRLSQADIDVLVSDGGLVLCGAGLIIKGVDICRATVLDCNDIWNGETAFGSWATAMGDLSWGGYDWTQVLAGSRLTVNFTVDETIGYTNLRFGNGSWAALPTTLADPATDADGNYSGFAADATTKSITLSQADINVLVNEGGLVLCGAGLVIKGVELCLPHQDGPAEECFEIVEEAFNPLDEKATYVNDTIYFNAANSAMNMWLGGIDLNGLNTLTIEYEATTDFQVLLQDAQGEEQFVAEADTNIVVYHYLANVDMAKLMQFIFVAQDSGAVKLNSICFSQVEYPTYYLGNKWDGAEEVSFREMSNDNHGDWFVTGVLGSDEVLLAFEAEPNVTVAYPISEIAEISGKELLIGDEVEFHCYEYLGNAFIAEVLARPTYVKHPWKDGKEWTWAMMTRNEELHQWEYTGVWGGQGFNINAAGPYDNGALWFAANDENVVYITTDGEEATEPAVGTEVTICYQDDDTQAGVRYTIATGLNSVKDGAQAIKLMENGQMFIIRDGKTYNIVGACVRNKK